MVQTKSRLHHYKLYELGKDVFQLQFLICKTPSVLVSLAEVTNIPHLQDLIDLQQTFVTQL